MTYEQEDYNPLASILKPGDLTEAVVEHVYSRTPIIIDKGSTCSLRFSGISYEELSDIEENLLDRGVGVYGVTWGEHYGQVDLSTSVELATDALEESLPLWGQAAVLLRRTPAAVPIGLAGVAVICGAYLLLTARES